MLFEGELEVRIGMVVVERRLEAVRREDEVYVLMRNTMTRSCA